eukprot:249251_1
MYADIDNFDNFDSIDCDVGGDIEMKENDTPIPHQRTNRRRPTRKRSRVSLFANDIDNNDSTNNAEHQVKKRRLNDKNKNKIISEKLVNQWLEYVGLDKHTSEYYD